MADVLTKEEIINSVLSALEKKNFDGESWEIIQRSTKKVLARCQKDFQGAAQDAASLASHRLSAGLKENLLSLASDFYDDTQGGSLLPQHCRYVRRAKGGISMLIEQPPNVRTVIINDSPYRLAMPYCVFALNFANGKLLSIHVGWRKSPIRSLEDKMSQVCLPNHDSNLSTCWGSTVLETEGKTVAEVADEYVGKWWQSQFNGDISGGFTAFQKLNKLSGPKDWAKRSADDPLWILKADFYSEQEYQLKNLLTLSDDKKVRHDHFLKNVTEQINKAVVEICERVEPLILEVKFTDHNRPKYSKEELSVVIKEIVVQSYAELCEYNEAVLSRERIRLEDDLATILREYEKYKKKNTW